jgi:hypothetical protein
MPNATSRGDSIGHGGLPQRTTKKMSRCYAQLNMRARNRIDDMRAMPYP